ncbi:hypothetical protein [Bailinhaonella thermotolerans]|uniref:Uncharacterized protein n=1 Tax=Bailinhaonella thermotolerans TaxID=1070861 RepID=A0A3A3ZZ44_9ACTN|nr:hypothetical protein [Bailinhaonella thermotolerans]RJL20384.1 hypothetical protein D5H75_39530 [Bailinhaonella thermotolerans]
MKDQVRIEDMAAELDIEQLEQVSGGAKGYHHRDNCFWKHIISTHRPFGPGYGKGPAVGERPCVID